MRKLFLKFKSAVGRINYMRSITYLNQRFLKDGIYHFVLNTKEFVLNINSNSTEFILKMNRSLNKKESKIIVIFYYLTNLFCKVIVNNDLESEFKGDILMKTRQDNIKIFNLDENLVLTLINDTDKYKELEEIYRYFHKYYNIPIIKIDNKNQLFVEKLVQYKPYRSWNLQEKQNAIKEIYFSLLKQVKEIRQNQQRYKTTASMLTELTIKVLQVDIIGMLSSFIPNKNYNDEWPIIKYHGDLNFNNILLENDKFYFIDWEDSAEGIFFHDLFNCIFVEEMYQNDNSFLKEYIFGKYDKYLINLFKCWSLNFEPMYRKYYIAIYIIDRIINFETKQNKNKIDYILNKYKVILKDIEYYGSQCPKI